MATSAGWNETTVELAGVKLHLLGGVRASLVVWGDDDKVVPRSAGQRYAALLPKARLEIVSAAGHCVDMDMEQPAEPDRLVSGVIEENRLIDRVSTGPGGTACMCRRAVSCGGCAHAGLGEQQEHGADNHHCKGERRRSLSSRQSIKTGNRRKRRGLH